MMFRALATLAFLTAGTGPALACLVCFELPERTIADRLVEADVVAFAREDPDNPFGYSPVALLRGEDPPPIPFLVNSSTRRRLAAAPEEAMLLAYETGNGWAQLAYADPAVQAMAEEIVAFAPTWQAGDAAARFAYFAERHDHPDQVIRQIALAEISAAPYASIRTIEPRLAREEIVAVLRDPNRAAWAPIHILFLGLSDDPADQAFVRRAIDIAARYGVRSHLDAWATAYVEIDGPAAVERLNDLYFDVSQPDPDALNAVVTAFSTLSRGGDPSLRPAIDAAFRTLAADGPASVVGQVAKQLLWAQDWSQSEGFAKRIASGQLDDPAAEYVVSLYLEAADEATRQPDFSADWSLD